MAPPPQDESVLDDRAVLRRAPFASNPAVGARGQKARARILDAALEVFGELGYHDTGVQRITELSGCSRVSFYQYFSNKEDLFRTLAGEVAHRLVASTEEVGPITADASGWDALHDWFRRYSTLYDAYEPVFVTFQTAAAVDAAVASGADRVAERAFEVLRSKVAGSDLPGRQVSALIRCILHSVARANRMSVLLEAAAPDERRRPLLDVALADVYHRALFGADRAVNAHPAPDPPLATTSAPPPPGPGQLRKPADGTAAGQTRANLLDAAHQVFVERGFYATRVSDIMAAAQLSHGVFYRYFENKVDVFQQLARRSAARLEGALDDLPRQADGDGAEALRSWLRRYADAYAAEASIIAMWVESMSYRPELVPYSTWSLEVGRRDVARFLARRRFGDVDSEAVVLLALLDSLTLQKVTPARVEAYALLIERGMLDRPR